MINDSFCFSSLAEDYFRDNRCFSCSDEEQIQVRKFLRKLQKQYPFEYNRMVREVTKRAEEPVFDNY
ncbi:hypothetical protein Anas_13849 [Armadillidium nasatum]|uniref:Uncharacterized protein n=1 Tax=Armadillidium nasatum TaxID=96803 RepID=A0A5N5SJL3_9CRUS|nr:hypothetical protein Anas_13849 [Armadillidium nasatum]